jgi:mono/diheme cytochrome c family protein
MTKLPRLGPWFTALCSVAIASLASAQSPCLPGLEGRHPLDQQLVGELLLGELRCSACHGPSLASALIETPLAPDLSEVGSRVSPEYLLRFLSDPSGVQHGSKMPQLLPSASPAQRAQLAEDLTHYLLSRSSAGFASRTTEEAQQALGRRLYHSVGCVACHGPMDGEDQAEAPRVVSLEHVSQKYGADSLAEFLFRPTLARPAGRMPDMGLSRAEARAIAEYLVPDAARADFAVDPSFAARGEALFGALRCAACHEPSSDRVLVPLERSGLDPTAGCLSESPTRSPDFGLDEAQRSALREALAAPRVEATSQERIAGTLTALNCIACHERDDFGGVAEAWNASFGTSQPELGDQARIPPPLTGVGAKLRPEWLQRVLLDDARVRPYMDTRMPRFEARLVDSLPALFAAVDVSEATPLAARFGERIEGDEEREVRDAGRELLGIRGLACISCHDFNSKPSPAFRGLDLITTCERLQPDWFVRFLLAPESMRPGIVMPQSWPGGVAVHKRILGGDTEAQLRAIWHYLTLGRSAADPEGISTPSAALEVTDEVRTYRGRSGVAGFRGIAVGFPGGLSYAFDARDGSLAALWTGGYVSVRWNSQGAGDFDPRGDRPRALPRDLSFFELVSDEDPWPLRPITTREEPVDPDPRYPSQHGYRFLGYRLDDALVPTLRYRCGDTEVTDRSEPLDGADRPTLRRTLTLESPEPRTLYFRAYSGVVEGSGSGELLAPRLRLRFPPEGALLRSNDDDSSELLLRLELPKGTTSFEVDYELLP